MTNNDDRNQIKSVGNHGLPHQKSRVSSFHAEPIITGKIRGKLLWGNRLILFDCFFRIVHLPRERFESLVKGHFGQSDWSQIALKNSTESAEKSWGQCCGSHCVGVFGPIILNHTTSARRERERLLCPPAHPGHQNENGVSCKWLFEWE